MTFGYLLTQEAQARECHSLLSSCSRFETRLERGGKNERGVLGGADGATANTKNGCGSGPPLSPTLQKEHIHQFPAKKEGICTLH